MQFSWRQHKIRKTKYHQKKFHNNRKMYESSFWSGIDLTIHHKLSMKCLNITQAISFMLVFNFFLKPQCSLLVHNQFQTLEQQNTWRPVSEISSLNMRFSKCCICFKQKQMVTVSSLKSLTVMHFIFIILSQEPTVHHSYIR